MKNPIKILHIEGNIPDREAFSRAVSKKGLSYGITSVGTLEKAREQLAEAFFDLIVADYELPDGYSTELLDEALNTPFILMTGTLEEQLSSRSLEHSADDYLLKDSEGRYLDVLPRAVQRILHRKQVVDQLKWARSRYSALFDRSIDLVYLLDINCRFVDVKYAAGGVLGETKEEIRSMDFLKLLASGQTRLAKKRMEQILKEGCTSGAAEFKLIRKDGETVFVETKESIVLHDGKPVAIQGIGRDITDRKRAEEALRESEEKFRGLAENMNAAAGIVQGQRFVHANRYMAQMLGYTVEEILSLTFPKMVHPADRDRLIDRARRRQMGETVPGNYEFRALTKNGETRWIDFSVGSMLYRGKPAIIGTGIDITERKRAEERLKLYTLGLKLLADSATGLLSTDNPMDLLPQIFGSLADHLGVKMFLNYLVTEDGTHLHLHSHRGVEPDAVKQIESIDFGQTLCGTVARQRRPMMIENVQQSVKPETAPLRQLGVRAYACHPLLGHRWLIGTLAFCADDRDSFGKEELELMRITSQQVAMALEHQRLTEELERRAAELAESNAAKDRFLAVLSHELRTPLTPVVMGVSMLQDRTGLDAGVRETLEMVLQNIEMEARLIDDLLDVTRIARGKIELKRNPVELCMVIRRAVEVCKPDIETRGLHFGLYLGPAAPYWVDGDESRLQQVFWNLLKNSIKFTPHGGYVGIRCQPGDPGEGDVVVEVNDSGIGIEPEALPRVFNAFEQGDPSRSGRFGGLGLGLTISKALIELHGGKIEAHSKGRNQGATFRIRLPLSPPAGQYQEISVAPATHVDHPLHILLVEDHGITARMIQMVLTEKGHMVETAGDISTALKLAGQRALDLLLSDLGLPDGSGYDLMRELRARGHKFPGIALSGYGQESDIRQSYEAGFTVHLTKPASRQSIIDAVESAAAGEGAKPDSSTTAQTAVPVFDEEAALRRCFGMGETLQQLISFFPAESTDLLGQMHSALDKGDLPEIGRAAHRLKGSVVYLAAQPAADAAISVEDAARSGDFAGTEKAVRELEHQIGLLRKALTAHSTK